MDLDLLKKLVAVAAAVTAIYGASWGYDEWVAEHPSLILLNASDRPKLTVLLDGKVVADDLLQAASETPSLARRVRLKKGHHTLVARDVAGVVSTVTFDVGPEIVDWFYAPAYVAETCFLLEHLEYAAAGAKPASAPRKRLLLYPEYSLWRLPWHARFVFQDAPSSMQSSTSTTSSSSLRQLTCEDPRLWTDTAETRESIARNVARRRKLGTSAIADVKVR